jgi:hypothetical protein
VTLSRPIEKRCLRKTDVDVVLPYFTGVKLGLFSALDLKKKKLISFKNLLKK